MTRQGASPLAGALALSIVAGCLPCQAAITYVNPADIPIPTNFAGIYLDLNSGTTSEPAEGSMVAADSYTITYSEPAAGTWDLNLFFGGVAMVHSDSINIYRATDDHTSAIHDLGIGTLVDGNVAGASQILGSPAFGGSGAYPADPHMGTGSLEFTHASDGYIGFVLDDPGGPLYGWMRVEFHNDGTEGWIKDWATSDSPLLVGQVPEPTVAALTAIALSGMALRRRRGR